MLKILHKRPWFITNNNSYRFTDANVWESTQKDFTFYIEFQLDEINTGDTHCIFCRPGMHMGVFAKNQNIITWDFWNLNPSGQFNDISFFVGKENLYKRYLAIVTHSYDTKTFEVKLKRIDDGKTFINTKTYDGELLDYSDTPFNFGIANYEHELSDEHKAISQYNLYRAGLFTKLYQFEEIEKFLDENKDCKRKLKMDLDESVFLINTNETTKYKAYDNSGNCFNLEINIGLIKKIYGIDSWRTLDINILGDERVII
tara:strand:- start:768 stop:1541 length:774 start_codon:yes stop_codon:yes gene_type:complete